jgi:hypothetical protein
MKLLQNLALLLVGLFVAAVCGELLVRHVAPQPVYRFPRHMFINDPKLGYRLSPHFVGVSKTGEYRTVIETNLLGLRESREYGTKAPHTMRILSIGDSFAMGVGVELTDTLAKVLERLASSTGQRFEVINAGVPGYNTRQEIDYLRLHGVQLDPDLVLLQFYVGNDITENHHDPHLMVVDGYLQRGPELAAGILPKGFRHWLDTTSHLYYLLWTFSRRAFDDSMRKREIDTLKSHLAIFEKRDDHDNDLMWRTTEHLLDELKSVAQSHSAGLLVLVIPDRIQVDTAAWASTVKRAGSSLSDYQIDKPNQRIVGYCKRLGIPVLDLLPILLEADSATYFKVDGHWTKRGNLIAAQAVDRALQSHELLARGRGRQPNVEGNAGVASLRANPGQ